jgi:hypothetical protein
MKSKMTSGLVTLASAFAITLFGAPQRAEAISVQAVTVTLAGNAYTAATVGWTLPVTLAGGQNLVLTQDQALGCCGANLGQYDFDLTDHSPAGSAAATIAVTVDGVTTTFTDTGKVLSINDYDATGESTDGSTVFNEAQVYSSVGTTATYQVFVAYADNLHSGVCGSGATQAGLSDANSLCLPTPFAGATVFDGVAGPLNGTGSSGGHAGCAGNTGCYDAGVIEIVATGTPPPPVPEPATMTLLGTGIVALVARRRRSAKAAKAQEKL